MTVTAGAAPPGPPSPAGLAELLRGPVRAALAARITTVRAGLPPRPVSALDRFTWLRSLGPGQARDAALLDRLEALAGHLTGRPAPGCAPDDPMPTAALDAADGFTDAPTGRLIALYRTERAAAIRPTPPATGTPNPTL
ncbi:hypothetical protein ACIOG4_37520 [Streptomyces microflavus]|uniref:hypothetical protein n=1 Tax=Streptomyces microflavus TaxID=1919 RepID=UPI003809960E